MKQISTSLLLLITFFSVHCNTPVTDSKRYQVITTDTILHTVPYKIHTLDTEEWKRISDTPRVVTFSEFIPTLNGDPFIRRVIILQHPNHTKSVSIVYDTVSVVYDTTDTIVHFNDTTKKKWVDPDNMVSRKQRVAELIIQLHSLYNPDYPIILTRDELIDSCTKVSDLEEKIEGLCLNVIFSDNSELCPDYNYYWDCFQLTVLLDISYLPWRESVLDQYRYTKHLMSTKPLKSMHR